MRYLAEQANEHLEHIAGNTAQAGAYQVFILAGILLTLLVHVVRHW